MQMRTSVISTCGGSAREPIGKARVHYLDVPPRVVNRRISTGKNGRFDEAYDIFRAARLARKIDADIVHVQNVRKGMSAFLNSLSKPTVVQVSKHLESRGAIEFLDRKLLSISRPYCLCSSEFLANESEKFSNWRRVDVIPPMIDMSRYAPASKHEARRALGIDEEIFLFGYMGRATKGRGVMTLLNAFERFVREGAPPDTRLLLGFSGDASESVYRKELEGYAARSVGNRLVHTRQGADVLMLYNALDVLVVPLNDFAAVDPPLTMLEAMSCGVAVVSSDIGSAREYLPRETVFPRGNEEALASMLANIAADRAGARELGCRLRERVMANSPEKLTGTYVKYYDSL